ncbi:MAG TPA: histidine kinase [Marinilabiliaceae bacterium]|nr:histidine kinase [Marinilabiliaceae bacterium]
MLHPVFSYRYNWTIIILFWIIHALIPAALLHYYAQLDWQSALIDGGVYSLFLILVGIALWFPIGYGPQKISISKKVNQNLLTGLVAVAIWLLLSGLSCRVLLANNPAYSELAFNVLPIRTLWGVEEFMMIMIMYHFFVFYRDLEEKRLLEEVLKKQVKESELKTLKAQLNPHFLFNSLNSVSALTIKQPESARHMISQLSELLRYSLSNKHTDLISLCKELENIGRYMEIEKVRFGDLLRYEEDVALECETCFVPAMILQPLYENAIKHGLYESLEAVTIKMGARVEAGDLHILIANNYDNTSVSTRGAGLGLRHTGNILRNMYNRDGLLVAGGSNGEYIVHLIIPQNISNG